MVRSVAYLPLITIIAILHGQVDSNIAALGDYDALLTLRKLLTTLDDHGKVTLTQGMLTRHMAAAQRLLYKRVCRDSTLVSER